MLGNPLSSDLVSTKVNGVSDLIRVSCAGQMFDIGRSEDLTLDKLRDEVARLMWCDPCQLIIIATDVDLEMDLKSVHCNPAACIEYAQRVHFACVDTNSSDTYCFDEMEDVEMS